MLYLIKLTILFFILVTNTLILSAEEILGESEQTFIDKGNEQPSSIKDRNHPVPLMSRKIESKPKIKE